MDRQLMPRVLAGGSGPTDWNEALDIISFGSPEQVSNLFLVFLLYYCFALDFSLIIFFYNHGWQYV